MRSLRATRLIEKFTQEDREAQNEVCRRYGERVARIVRQAAGSALRSREGTADLAQEALWEMVRSSPGCRFESEAAFLGWVRRIVEHRIFHAARHWKAQRRGAAREVPLTPTREGDSGASSQSPSSILESKERIDNLSRVLARVAALDREVLIYRAVLDLPWAKVAIALETTQAAAQMRFNRARKRLQRLTRSAD